MTGRVAATATAARLRRGDGAAVEWRREAGPVDYAEAVAAMEARAAAIRAGGAPELVWLLEHPALYTAGTGARGTAGATLPFPLHETGRGGQLTYHGPGQRIAYAHLDLQARGGDVRAYVGGLEAWLIAALARLGVTGERRDERVGIWIRRPDKPAGPHGEPAEDKIAALGVRVRRGVAFHGISLNVAPCLGHFAAITPCGIAEPHLGVTSLAALGAAADMGEVDAALRRAFAEVFG